MSNLKIYQIGLIDHGRNGFEKLIEITQEKDSKAEFEGIFSDDSELEDALKFAESNNTEIKTFGDLEKLFQDALQYENVLIYDAGPVSERRDIIQQCRRFDFSYLGEKPPTMSKNEHLKIRELSNRKNFVWMVDNVEKENLSVINAAKAIKDLKIESIQVFRESTAGVLRIYDPVQFQNVQGGDILDKMMHESYVQNFLNEELEIEDIEIEAFMPKGPNSDSFMTTHGSKVNKINQETATARTCLKLRSGDVYVELNSSWIGVSEKAFEAAREIQEKTGHDILETGIRNIGEDVISFEEARFFIIRGEKDLAGDLNSQQLYNLDKGEKIDEATRIHDPMYRVMRKAVQNALNHKKPDLSEENRFIETIFEARERGIRQKLGSDDYEELDKARSMIKELVLETVSEEAEA